MPQIFCLHFLFLNYPIINSLHYYLFFFVIFLHISHNPLVSYHRLCIDYLASPYHHQLIPLGPQVMIDEQNYKIIYELLTPYMQIVDSLTDKNDYKNVALEFYFDSLEKYGIAQITYAVIAIEALFNTGKEEITKTVVQRGLKILQNYYEPEYWEQIETDFKNAYDVRSYYAHGIKRRYKKATFELSERISEYARIILLTFLFIAPKVSLIRKKENEKNFINKKIIDKSLFYPETNTELKELLKGLPIKIKNFNELGERPDLRQGLEFPQLPISNS